MNARPVRNLIAILTAVLFVGCANIVPPAGGDKDITPPKLVRVTPADSGLNVRTGKVRFDFDEYVTVTDATNQVIISPLLPVPPVVTSLSKHVIITVPDSLLLENTTYRITLGTAIRDLNESNIYKGRGYIFSTGAYFDSLSLSGNVINAMTGMPDTTANILLYNAADGDSAVVRKRPLYATHVDGSGNFSLQGLPGRSFRIYALRDKNANLLFDDRTEWIAFNNTPLTPGQDSNRKLTLRTFPLAGGDSSKVTTPAAGNPAGNKESSRGVGYSVAVDTTDTKRRSQDINKPLSIVFTNKVSGIDKNKLFLAADSNGTLLETPIMPMLDSTGHILLVNAKWMENTVYSLRLQKGFAKDSLGNDFLPGRYPFRTKRDDDYAKLSIHLPTKYYGAGYVLQVTNETDTIYKKPVLDSNVTLARIPPGNYKLLLIVDENHNGHWDTGDLFGKKQPEQVIPFDHVIMLKPGWENQQDFEPAPAKPAAKSPQKTTPAVPR